jgi:hypothetical protein
MRFAPVILLLPLAIACAGLPRIVPAGGAEKANIMNDSRAPFLRGPRRLVHSIDGTLPGGSRATMIGISAAEPDTGRIRCTLMSIEGLVLLDAEYDAKLIIRRGIGPLASPGLVAGMLRDIRLILFRPAGTVADAGTLGDGSRACRYRTDEGVVDVIMKEGGAVELIAYDRYLRVTRRVLFSGSRKMGMPENIRLIASGTFGYTLDLDLIEAEPAR